MFQAISRRVALFSLIAGGAPLLGAADRQDGVLPWLGLGVGNSRAGTSVSAPMQVVILLTVLTLLPAVVVSVTPFLRLTVVLHFLRQALGTQSTPSNQVLIGLSLFLTILIMQPVATDMYSKGWEPLQKNQLSASAAFDEGTKPLKAFLVRFAREKDVKLFLEISRTPAPRVPADLDLKVLIPAYILSELRTGFQIGAVLFMPFLIIDLVVASVTLSVGMIQLPPVMISAPFKILLFVLVDGWNLIIGSLMKTFY
jgi:flagellar biosynthetic protein FliP